MNFHKMGLSIIAILFGLSFCLKEEWAMANIEPQARIVVNNQV